MQLISHFKSLYGYYQVQVVLFLAMLVLGVFVPLVADEIDWRIYDRSFLEGMHSSFIFPQCRQVDALSYPIPLSWYFSATVRHILYVLPATPLGIKIAGLVVFACFMVACGFVLWGLRKSFGNHGILVAISFFSLFYLDTLSFLIQIKRPEQDMLLMVTVLLVLAVNADTIVNQPAFRKGCALTLLAACVLYIFPLHPKAIALLPVVLACVCVFLKKLRFSSLITILSGVLITAFAVQSVLFWLILGSCPQSEFINKFFIIGRSLPIHLIVADPLEFLKQAGIVFAFAVVTDFTLFHPSLWLPFTLNTQPYVEYAAQFPAVTTIIVRALIFIASLVCIIKCLTLPLAKKAGLLKEDPFHATPALRLIACASFISLLAVMVVSGKTRVFYLASLDLPLLYLTGLLCTAVTLQGYVFPKSLRFVMAMVCIAATCNIALLAVRYYPLFTAPESRETVFDYKEYVRTITQSPFDYQRQEQQINAAYQACGLPVSAQHVIVDTHTYPALRFIPEPYLYHYINQSSAEEKYVPGREEFIKLVMDYRADGVLVKCNQVHNSHRGLYREFGEYCCLNTGGQ